MKISLSSLVYFAELIADSEADAMWNLLTRFGSKDVEISEEEHAEVSEVLLLEQERLEEGAAESEAS